MPKSLLEWLGFPYRESTARDLLAWLIDTEGADVLEPLLHFRPSKLKHPQGLAPILTEEPLGRSSRIDLLVHTEQALIGIEVKVNSGLGRRQLLRYAEGIHSYARSKYSAMPRLVLLYVTETGGTPRPSAIDGVEVTSATWDLLCDRIPAGDPLGWKQAAIERRHALRSRIEQVLDPGQQMRLDERADAAQRNELARALWELGTRLSQRIAIPLASGPSFGAQGSDAIVDLACSDWAADLGMEPNCLLRDLDEAHDGRLHFALRLRLKIDMLGRLSLGLGTLFVPYLMAIPKKHREPVFRDCSAALTRGYELRRLLLNATKTTNTDPSDDIFHLDHYLVKADQWQGDRVEYAAQCVAHIRSSIDETLAQWKGLEAQWREQRAAAE
jgi:hypothetical protein